MKKVEIDKKTKNLKNNIFFDISLIPRANNIAKVWLNETWKIFDFFDTLQEKWFFFERSTTNIEVPNNYEIVRPSYGGSPPSYLHLK